jgi:hypothetical protein
MGFTTPNDLEAVTRALEQVLEDPEWCELFEWKLATDDRDTVLHFAAYNCQVDNLRLNAAEDPPCEIDDPDAELAKPDFRGNHAAARLLKRMRALGISDYEPDPMRAIESRHP